MGEIYTIKPSAKEKKYGCIHQKSVKETAPLHNHEAFYEMFIVTQGRALHLVNGTIQHLKRGSLVFVRPSDLHKYDYDKNYDFEFINFSFPEEAVKEMQEFLDDSKKFQEMLDARYSPLVNISLKDSKILETELIKFKSNFLNSNKEVSNNSFKIYLLKLINDYFLEDYHSNIDKNMPSWLMYTLTEMQSVENFSVGLTRMIELANCTQEHLTRVCKQYVGDTPTNIINNNRLDYSGYLLKTTNLDIIEIQNIVGFNNLSHFYHLFKKKFECSPRQFRIGDNLIN